MKRAVELRADEKKLHDNLPAHLQRLLLWKEILVDLEYPDYKVVDEICQGFPLTGWAEQSTVFQKQVRSPTVSLQQLTGMARGLNMAVVTSLETAEWQDVDEAAWQETMQEVDQGWLAEEPSLDLDRHFIAKRFPIQQKDRSFHLWCKFSFRDDREIAS